MPKRGRAESLQTERVIKIAREKTDDGWNDVRSRVYDDSDAGAFVRKNCVQIEVPMYEKWEMAARVKGDWRNLKAGCKERSTNI